MLCLVSNVIVRSDSPCVRGFSNQNQRNIYLFFLGLAHFRKKLLGFFKFELTPFGLKTILFHLHQNVFYPLCALVSRFCMKSTYITYISSLRSLVELNERLVENKC